MGQIMATADSLSFSSPQSWPHFDQNGGVMNIRPATSADAESISKRLWSLRGKAN